MLPLTQCGHLQNLVVLTSMVAYVGLPGPPPPKRLGLLVPVRFSCRATLDVKTHLLSRWIGVPDFVVLSQSP